MLSRKGYILATLVIFLIIVIVNLKFGFVLIGNDNFSPELAPSTTLDRSLFGPGWREYRALGVPSDSEQSDIFRTALYALAATAKIPSWIISNAYYFFTFLIAFYSAGKVVSFFALKFGLKLHNKDESQDQEESDTYWMQFLGGLFYIGSLLAIWIYFFPVHLFVAAFAFFPLVAWRLIEYARNRSSRNLFTLATSALFLSTAALTATVFFVIYGALIAIIAAVYVGSKTMRKGIIVGLAYVLLLQLYWLMPFALYVRSNTQALQSSLINRKITALQIQNEEKYNSLFNTPRYAFSWIDDKIDDTTYAYTDRSWFKENPLGKTLTFMVPLFALLGVFALLRGKTKWGWVFILQVFAGLFLIKGTNPPFGFLYGIMEDNSSVFAQVFRWRSSKFWPFLALSMPILAGIGVLYVQQAYTKATTLTARRYKVPTIFVVAAIFAILLMKPYFTGSMIRPSMYTQVPPEYYALREYLNEKDPHGRIYVVPEANTLYFRNYDWGFFGSVMLNYVLQNPTFEKALVIGSKESEAASEVIKNAYYSRNKEVFARALDQFDVQYILVDKHATQGVAGYPYDLSLVDDMTANNIFLQREWQEGSLALYSVYTADNAHSFEKINPQHDINKLSLYEILQDTNFTYVSKPNDIEQASLYPFALNYDNFMVNTLTNTVKLTAPLTLQGDYSATLVQSDFLDVPTSISSTDPLFITLTSAFPRIKFNQSELTIDTPHVMFQKNPEYTVHSLGNRVLTSDSLFIETPYGRTIENPVVRGWKSNRMDEYTRADSPTKLYCNNSTNLKNMMVDGKLLCGTDKVTVQADTVLVIDTNLSNSENPIQGALCVKSLQKGTCLNIQRHVTLDQQASVHVAVPEVISAGDTYEIFFEFEETNPSAAAIAKLTVDQFRVSLYDQSVELAKVVEKPAPQNQTFTVHVDGDVTFSMEMPLIQSESSLIETGKEPTTLKSSYEPYTPEKSHMLMSINNTGITIEHTESAFSRFTDIPFNSRDSLAMVLVKGRNTQGIPADIKIKNPKQGASVYENKLLLNDQSIFYDFIVIPEGNPIMNLEVFSPALGPVASVNQLEDLVVQNIPRSWLQLKLVPSTPNTYLPVVSAQPALPKKESNVYIANMTKNSIMALPTAKSPYWAIRKIADSQGPEALKPQGGSIFTLIGVYTDFLFAGSNASRKEPARAVTLNQWQQGFEVYEDGVYQVIFWPNLLIYLGYILNISIFISLGLSFVRRKNTRNN